MHKRSQLSRLISYLPGAQPGEILVDRWLADVREFVPELAEFNRCFSSGLGQ